MVNKLIDGVSFLKAKFQTDELDEKLNQAVSEQNWQASTQLLHQIANASYNFQKQQRVLAFIWDKLKNKSWRKVLKTLHLVDFLAKNGPTSLVNAFKENVYDFRNFDNYTLVAQGIDRGESIRKQSKVIVDLLSDDHSLNEERAKAKQIKERMANVIGSGAYYGSYSNDGPINGSKKEPYQSFGSNSNKFGGTSNFGGMSFGQSVMKTLSESKRVQPRVQQPVYEQKPTSKLNLSQMNERKPESNKNTFNNLNMKLVKPPEKKPMQKKVETSPPAQTKVQQKPTGKTNIMDLDLVSFMDNSQKPQAKSQVNSTANVDPFDFLSGTSAPTPQSKPIQNVSQPIQNATINNPLNFELTNSKQSTSIQQYPTQNTSTQPTHYPQANNFLINQNPYSGSNYNQTQYSNQGNNFSLSQQAPLSQPQIPVISLTPTQQPKPQTSTASNLIDFSNFREELNIIGHQQQKKNIVQQWNW